MLIYWFGWEKIFMLLDCQHDCTIGRVCHMHWKDLNESAEITLDNQNLVNNIKIETMAKGNIVDQWVHKKSTSILMIPNDGTLNQQLQGVCRIGGGNDESSNMNESLYLFQLQNNTITLLGLLTMFS